MGQRQSAAAAAAPVVAVRPRPAPGASCKVDDMRVFGEVSILGRVYKWHFLWVRHKPVGGVYRGVNVYLRAGDDEGCVCKFKADAPAPGGVVSLTLHGLLRGAGEITGLNTEGDDYDRLEGPHGVPLKVVAQGLAEAEERGRRFLLWHPSTTGARLARPQDGCARLDGTIRGHHFVGDLDYRWRFRCPKLPAVDGASARVVADVYRVRVCNRDAEALRPLEDVQLHTTVEVRNGVLQCGARGILEHAAGLRFAAAVGVSWSPTVWTFEDIEREGQARANLDKRPFMLWAPTEEVMRANLPPGCVHLRCDLIKGTKRTREAAYVWHVDRSGGVRAKVRLLVDGAPRHEVTFETDVFAVDGVLEVGIDSLLSRAGQVRSDTNGRETWVPRADNLEDFERKGLLKAQALGRRFMLWDAPVLDYPSVAGTGSWYRLPGEVTGFREVRVDDRRVCYRWTMAVPKVRASHCEECTTEVRLRRDGSPGALLLTTTLKCYRGRLGCDLDTIIHRATCMRDAESGGVWDVDLHSADGLEREGHRRAGEAQGRRFMLWRTWREALVPLEELKLPDQCWRTSATIEGIVLDGGWHYRWSFPVTGQRRRSDGGLERVPVSLWGEKRPDLRVMKRVDIRVEDGMLRCDWLGLNLRAPGPVPAAEPAPEPAPVAEPKSEERCPICYEAYDDDTRRRAVYQCGHLHCTGCMAVLRRRAAPYAPECTICRARVTAEIIVRG